VELVETLGDRVVAVHVKDGPLGDHIVTGVPPVDQTAAEQGGVPLAAALRAAAWLEYAVVEFDGYQGDIFQAITASHAFLTDSAAAPSTGTARSA
jgi:sugar phosphate isomerase/epimerase